MIDDLIICPRCLRPMGDDVRVIICQYCGYKEGEDINYNNKKEVEED